MALQALDNSLVRAKCLPVAGKSLPSPWRSVYSNSPSINVGVGSGLLFLSRVLCLLVRDSMVFRLHVGPHSPILTTTV